MVHATIVGRGVLAGEARKMRKRYWSEKDSRL